MVRIRGIRQVAAIVPDLEPVVERLHALFDVEPSTRQELTPFGLKNAVIPIGEQFLELLQPIRDDVSGARYLAKRGPGFYMLIFEGTEGVRPREEAEQAGIPVVWTADRERFCTVHFHPKSMAGVLVSVDTSKIPDDWPPAGPDWRDYIRSDVVTGIHVFRVAGFDTVTMAAPFTKLFDIEVISRQPRGQTEVARARVAKSGTYIDFVAPTDDSAHLADWLRQRGPGPWGIEMQVRSIDAVIERCGRIGVAHRPRTGGPDVGWQAIHLAAEDTFGLPITLVESLRDENPWDRGA